jgi:transposase
MGRPAKKLSLSKSQRSELEKGYREGKSHAVRQRCQMMLLKSEARSSAEVAEILGCCEVVINTWMKRYESEGLAGLQTKAGRGRKAILHEIEDLAQVRKAVQANRQRLSLAKADLEEALDKQLSTRTLERYVKKMLVVINASENVLSSSPVQKRMPTKSKR